MALELQVYIAVVDTEPGVPGNPGMVIRSQKTSTLVVGNESSVADVWKLAGARLKPLIEDCTIDAGGQIEVLETAAKREGL